MVGSVRLAMCGLPSTGAVRTMLAVVGVVAGYRNICAV